MNIKIRKNLSKRVSILLPFAKSYYNDIGIEKDDKFYDYLSDVFVHIERICLDKQYSDYIIIAIILRILTKYNPNKSANLFANSVFDYIESRHDLSFKNTNANAEDLTDTAVSYLDLFDKKTN